jgi:hypothetical protein
MLYDPLELSPDPGPELVDPDDAGEDIESATPTDDEPPPLQALNARTVARAAIPGISVVRFIRISVAALLMLPMIPDTVGSNFRRQSCLYYRSIIGAHIE